jgi:hypothetical protein
VTRVREAATVAEAPHIMMKLVVETSAKEAAIARESIVTLVTGAKDHACLSEWEARDRMSRVEAESAAVLASTREEAESNVRRVALLEGELPEAH